MRTNGTITVSASTTLPTQLGTFEFRVWQSSYDNKEHVLLSQGDLTKLQEPVLVRVHSQCVTGECFLSLKCDCQAQLHEAMKMVQQQGQGLIIYLHQEGRGIGLVNKIKAYYLQEQGLDTVEANEALGFQADQRDYQPAIDLLYHLSITSIHLISNNPRKLHLLKEAGISIDRRIPIQIPPNPVNRSYLRTKKSKLGHLLDQV